MRYYVDWVHHWAHPWGICLIRLIEVGRSTKNVACTISWTGWVPDGIKSELNSIHSSPPASWLWVCCEQLHLQVYAAKTSLRGGLYLQTVSPNKSFLHIVFFFFWAFYSSRSYWRGRYHFTSKSECWWWPPKQLHCGSLCSSTLPHPSLHPVAIIFPQILLWLLLQYVYSLSPPKLTWKLLWSNPSIHCKYALLSWLIKGWLGDS